MEALLLLICFAIGVRSVRKRNAQVQMDELIEAAEEKPSCTYEDKRMSRLERAASIAEIDIEYLEPLLNKQERAMQKAHDTVELYELAGTSAPAAVEKAYDKSRKEYYATLKKYMKAQNVIADWQSAG